jgi:hypothetical protein
MLTRGIIWLVGKGATWPSHGLPRGTPLLVDRFQCKIRFDSVAGDSNPRPPDRAMDYASWANHVPGG